MKKHTKIGLMLLVTVVLLLALAVPGAAKKQSNFEMTFSFEDVDWDQFYATGNFNMTEPYTITDEYAVIHWIPRTGTKQGTMFLEASEEDTFVIRFNISKDIGNYCGSGHFDVVAFRGTGDFEGMWGTGDMTLCRPDWGDDVNGELIGWVNFDLFQ